MDVINRVGFWFDNLKPEVLEQTMEKQKAEASLKEAFINLALASLPISLLIFIFMAVFGQLNGVVLGLIISIAIIIFLPLIEFVSQGIYWIIAKLLGGSGTYAQQTYFRSISASVILLISILLIIPLLIPCIGIIVRLIIALFLSYYQYLVIKSVHGLSTSRSIAVVLAPVLLIVLLMLAMVVAYVLMILAILVMSVISKGF